MDALTNILLCELLEGYSRSTIKTESEKRRKKIYRNILLLKSLKNCRPKRNIPKITNYIEQIKQDPDDVFKNHFRMKKSTFEKLVKLLEPYWKNQWTGRPKVDVEKSLYLTIWRLGNQTEFRIIADRFNVGLGSAFLIFKKMTRLLTTFLDKFVRWPKSRDEMRKIMENFQNIRQDKPFPNVIGCIDSTHIQVPTPKGDSKSYYNRKGTHSIILQGVCDSQLRFLDVFFGWAGRSHDACVWKNSPLKEKLENGTILLPEDSHLLGDSAYPLSQYLMVPFRDNGCLTATQKKFNWHLCSTRVCIEQAFGVLKEKFRILKYSHIYNLQELKYVVISCIVLHNFIIESEGIDIENIIFYDCDNENESTTSDFFCESGEATFTEAKQKRDRIAHLFMC